VNGELELYGYVTCMIHNTHGNCTALKFHRYAFV